MSNNLEHLSSAFVATPLRPITVHNAQIPNLTQRRFTTNTIGSMKYPHLRVNSYKKMTVNMTAQPIEKFGRQINPI